MQGEKAYKILILITSLIGVSLITISINPFFKSVKLFRNGIYTRGKIVKVDKINVFVGAINLSYVEFIDNRGHEHTIPSKGCKRDNLLKCPQIGSSATVVFNPNSPQDAKVIRIYSQGVTHDFFVSEYLAPLSPAIIGIIMILVGFVLFRPLRSMGKLKWT